MTAAPSAVTNRVCIETIDYENPDRSVLERVAATLEAGMLVVGPTETKYGMLARADDNRALNKLFRTKGRANRQPVAVFVKSPKAVGSLGRLTPGAERLAQRFLPGPLTLVLEAFNPEHPAAVNGKIGIRCSPAPFIRELVALLDFPITATSANLSGLKELERIEHIARQFGGKVQFYVDGGIRDEAVSTVVDATGEEPVILRQGSISQDKIRAAFFQEAAR